MKRQAASPADILRLLKQPVGPTRVAVRAADYMNNALMLISSMTKRKKRSINATGPSSGQLGSTVHSNIPHSILVFLNQT